MKKKKKARGWRQKARRERAYKKRLKKQFTEREWFGYCNKCGRPWQMCDGCLGSREVKRPPKHLVPVHKPLDLPGDWPWWKRWAVQVWHFFMGD